METLLEQISEQMVSSLKGYAKDNNVSLERIRILFKKQNTDGLNALDEVFKDGGEGRYDYFSSFSHDYARTFTTDHLSDLYDEKRWEVELHAMKKF